MAAAPPPKAVARDATVTVGPDDLGWRGVVALERHPEGVQPWRVPPADRELFDPGLVIMASAPSGVRICFSTDATTVSLTALRLRRHLVYDYDLVVDGVLADTVTTAPEEPLADVTLENYRERLAGRASERGTDHTVTLRVKPAPTPTVHRCELYLSQMGPQVVSALALGDATVYVATAGAPLVSPRGGAPVWLGHHATSSVTRPTAGGGHLAAAGAGNGARKPVWLAHGSSITHSIGIDAVLGGANPLFPMGSGSAWSPARAWPATAARLADVDYISLGFGGQCVLDPPVARMIRDMGGRVDCIALKLGINVHNHGSHSLRSFAQAALGFLQTVRDGHPGVPIVVVSPIHGGWREGLSHSANPLVPDIDKADPRFPTLQQMREELERVVGLLRARGDDHLRYLDGRELFDKADFDAGLAPDHLHPNGDGYELMGRRFTEHAFGDGGLLLPGRLSAVASGQSGAASSSNL